MAKEQETWKMMELYRNGATCQEIGDLYGLTQQAVWQRFARRGWIEIGHRITFTQIDKEQLGNLYAVEKLPIEKIASALGGSPEVIKKALKLHGIPKRQSLRQSGKHVALLEKLNIGDQIEIQLLNKHPLHSIRRAARSLGIKVSLRSLGGHWFQIARVEENKGFLTYRRIDKNRLETLYLVEELPLSKIAAAFKCSQLTISNAVEYHAIPKRRPLIIGGPRVDVLSNLAVGQQIEIAC